MPKVSVNGETIYYELHGKGHPLVLIAGFTCDTSFWKRLVENLSSHFQLLIFDNRGVGQSESPDAPYTVDDMAEDTVALIHKLGLKKPHILGHSMGGAIAQTIALKHEKLIGKLILCNTLVKFSKLSAFVEKFILHLREAEVPQRLLVEAALPWILSTRFFEDNSRVEQFIQLQLNHPFLQSNIGFKRQLDALLIFDSRDWFQKIQAPTLVIHGEEDIICPRDSYVLAEGIKGARFQLIPKVGHLPIVEAPLALKQAIQEFLESSH